MKRILLIILSLLFINEIFSCDCKTIERDSSVSVGLRCSDIVFCGKLLDYDQDNFTYRFVVYELYKGDCLSDTIYGECQTNCSIFPMTEGLWIVYANKIDERTIDIDGCLHSLPLDRPEGIRPPPKLSEEVNIINELKSEIEKLEYRIEGTKLWYVDLEKLREYRKNNETKNLEKNEIINTKREIELKEILFLVSIIVNILLVFLIIKRKKNK